MAAKLWGWGNNNNGQLALNNGSMKISQPMEIPLPPFKGDIEIIDVICGMNQTILATKDELWMSEPFTKNPKKEEEPQPQTQPHKKKGKKDKGEKSEKESEDHEKNQQGHSWFNITPFVKNAE
jgi:alpha-tubulin suppressor-like RCC1 family protein